MSAGSINTATYRRNSFVFWFSGSKKTNYNRKRLELRLEKSAQLLNTKFLFRRCIINGTCQLSEERKVFPLRKCRIFDTNRDSVMLMLCSEVLV